MKKILLGTSALISAVALFAGVAHAEDASAPKVTLGGVSVFEGGWASQDKKTTLGNTSSHPTSFFTDNTVIVKADGKTNLGLGYGAEIDLEADTSNDSQGAGVNAKRTFVYVDGKWGKLQGGSDLGVTNTMKVDASEIARASGGINGDFYRYLNAPSYVSGGNHATRVIATPNLYLDYGAGVFGDQSKEVLNKISYYTPRVYGVQAGVSFLPTTNATSYGQTVNNSNGKVGATKNTVLGAINYDSKFSGVGVKVGATGEYGKADDSSLVTTQKFHDLKTYQAGAKFSYMGASLAGAYGHLGNSLEAKYDVNGNAITKANSTYFWDIGAAYETGPFGASVTYLKSSVANGTTTVGKVATNNGKNSFSNISVGADYKLAAGLKPFAEVNFVKYNPTGTVNDNKATIGIVGTQLQF